MRVWRWVVVGLGLGVLPLGLGYLVHAYYRERPPTAVELLGGGEALLVVVAWSATAVFDLLDGRASAQVRFGCATVAVPVLLAGTVAYACLTADLATGRVQTRGQARFITTLSLGLLAVAGAVSTVAAATSGRGKESP